MPEDDPTQTSGSESFLETPSRRRFLTVAAATGAAATLGGTAVAQQSSATVTFDDQTTGGETVTVASTTLPSGGYVAIHDERLFDGKALESVVGVSEFLESGSHEDVEVTLFDVEGAEFEQEMLEEDQTLVAMPHRETNGNETYEFVASGGEMDGPYTADGGAVVDDAAITIESTEEPMADVCFPDQLSDGKTVTVPEATLSEGGFVVIHDSSLQDGEVFGSVIGVSEALDAGTHTDLEIDLFEGVPGGDFDAEKLMEDETLVAMPHFDSNDNDSYDFITSEGEEDGPYTMDGKPVVNPGEITVEEGC